MSKPSIKTWHCRGEREPIRISQDLAPGCSPSIHVEQARPLSAAFLRLFPFPATPRGQRAAGTDAGQDQTLLVRRQVEEAEDDAVDQEVEFRIMDYS